jgi:hypothetical protein
MVPSPTGISRKGAFYESYTNVFRKMRTLVQWAESGCSGVLGRSAPFLDTADSTKVRRKAIVMRPLDSNISLRIASTEHPYHSSDTESPRFEASAPQVRYKVIDGGRLTSQMRLGITQEHIYLHMTTSPSC